MTSLELAQIRLIEAVDSRTKRTAEEQRKVLSDLLAMAFAASRESARI
jgi:hypothetical protein